MGSKASCRSAAFSGFIIVQCRDDMEWVQTTVLCISHIDDPTVEIVCQLRILVLRIQDEDLGILGSQIQKQGFRGIRFTGTGLTDNNHVGIHTFRVSPEEIDEYRDAVGGSQLHATFIRNMRKNPRVHSRNRIRGNTPGFLNHRIIIRDL